MEYQENKIVIFDWGGIVESHREGEYNFFKVMEAIIKMFNPKIQEKEVVQGWEECTKDENGIEIGTCNDIEQIKKWYKRLEEKFHLKADFITFMNSYQKEFEKIYFYREVVGLEHQTKERCKIGILSNLMLIDKERINAQVNLSKFDYVWLSFEMGERKPSKKIYEMVQEECKIEPQNILFVEDAEENIKTAQSMGWNTCKAYGYEIDKIKQRIETFLQK